MSGDGLAVVWDDGYLAYDLGGAHPLHPVRLALTMRLAGRLGVLGAPGVRIVRPEPASRQALARVHDPAYIAAVEAASGDPEYVGHGMGTSDNPVFPAMHTSAALISGGSIRAAELVWSGAARHAVNIAGGLHHAMWDHASGFCVYNDPALAIATLVVRGARRVAYVDVDVHHGDGVQAAFYGDPRVLTISLHQSPLTLFPGTGFPEETGVDAGEGYAVNVALPPRTDDQGWLRAFHAVVPPLLRAFRPEILVAQCGCDSHHEDPLADLALTIDGQRASYAALHALAHELCDGRWVAMGGGGYGLVRCVPRAWTHLLAEAAEAPLDPGQELPPAWRDEAGRLGGDTSLPASMTEGGGTTYVPWTPGGDGPLDQAIGASRRAVFPRHGLDPDQVAGS